MVSILHIETFVTFDFDPFLISRLITDSSLNPGRKLGYRIAKTFDLTPKNRKSYCSAFLFFSSGINEQTNDILLRLGC